MPKTFELLKKRGRLTANALVRLEKISKPAALRRLKALDSDERFKEHIAKKKTREGERGTESDEYFFV